MNALAIALNYIARGWRPVPVPHRKKAPVLAGWQTLRIDAESASQYFNGQPQNIGVILGAASNNLADVDLDCPEAIACANYLLPTTRAIFGRASARGAHRLYRIVGEQVGESATYGLKDPTPGDGKKAMLVELRTGSADNGAQTVFPGSTHVSGEPIFWDEEGDPLEIPASDLLSAVRLVAAAALLARAWPGEGARHDAALTVGGVFFGAGFDKGRVELVATAIARAAGDPEWKDRARAAKDAAGAVIHRGFPALRNLVGERRADRIAEWIGYQGAQAGGPSPRSDAPGAPRWLEVTRTGAPRASYHNARAALAAFADLKFSYERFADRAYVGDDTLSDELSAGLRQRIIDAYAFDPGKENVHDAAIRLCFENSHDRVVDWLDALQATWDGTERLSHWLSDYLGADDTPLNALFGRKVLIAAVRRARAPGCKFDCILTLIGNQGAGKSLAARTLAGEDALFSDQDVLHLHSREQQEALGGVWIYELSELVGLAKADVERVKAFVSRTHDRARKVWGRFSIDQPRRSIFIATTNSDTFLRDYTGNRRFWPVRVGDILLQALKRDRDQLWAEAARAEAEGEALTLPADMWCEAEAAQAEHLEDDPWVEVLATLRGTIVGDEERVSFADVASRLDLAKKDQTRAVQARLTEVMKRLGWSRNGKAAWIDGRITKCYRRAVRSDAFGYEKDNHNQ